MRGEMAAIAAAALGVASPVASTDGQATPAKAGYLFLPFRGGIPFDVEVDEALVTSLSEHEAQIVDMRGNLVTMTDSYRSKTAADAGCADGREVYVRLLDLATRRERAATLARSCVRGIAAADPIVTWKADASGYTVDFTDREPLWVDARTGD